MQRGWLRMGKVENGRFRHEYFQDLLRQDRQHLSTRPHRKRTADLGSWSRDTGGGMPEIRSRTVVVKSVALGTDRWLVAESGEGIVVLVMQVGAAVLCWQWWQLRGLCMYRRRGQATAPSERAPRGPLRVREAWSFRACYHVPPELAAQPWMLPHVLPYMQSRVTRPGRVRITCARKEKAPVALRHRRPLIVPNLRPSCRQPVVSKQARQQQTRRESP